MGLINDIKNEAKGKRIKVQSTQLTELDRLFNAMFFLDKNIEEETIFVHNVMTRGLASQERIGLHASSFIVSDKQWCARQQVLSLLYRQLQGEQLPVNVKRIFAQGDTIHEKWQRLFIRAGYATADDCDVTKFNKKYRISFTPDIIAHDIPIIDGKVIVEFKSVNTFQFQKMEHHPSAGKQAQWYMFLSSIPQAIVLNEDKNTQEFKLEYHEYDTKVVAPFIERAESVKYYYSDFKRSGKMLPRPKAFKKADCKRCSECNLRDACWNIGKGRIKL